MSYTMQDSESIYIGCFDEIAAGQFKFIATDLKSYFIENLTFQDLIGLFTFLQIAKK